jgi:hypothetical protein
MGNFIASGLFLGILGGLAYIYLSIRFDSEAYVRKVKKYKKIQLFKLSLKNRRKRRGS